MGPCSCNSYIWTGVIIMIKFFLGTDLFIPLYHPIIVVTSTAKLLISWPLSHLDLILITIKCFSPGKSFLVGIRWDGYRFADIEMDAGKQTWKQYSIFIFDHSTFPCVINITLLLFLLPILNSIQLLKAFPKSCVGHINSHEHGLWIEGCSGFNGGEE